MTADVRATLAELRQQLADMATSLGPYAPPVEPTRLERRNPDRRGPVWDVPLTEPLDRNHAALRVRALDAEPGHVFVEGANFSYADDWHALSSREARSFAMALLAAADWSDGLDELGVRRQRRTSEPA